MNRFMYLNKRNLSTQGIKSLYPKCINCINFKREIKQMFIYYYREKTEVDKEFENS
jgi:hypothetical protein